MLKSGGLQHKNLDKDRDFNWKDLSPGFGWYCLGKDCSSRIEPMTKHYRMIREWFRIKQKRKELEKEVKVKWAVNSNGSK